MKEKFFNPVISRGNIKPVVQPYLEMSEIDNALNNCSKIDSFKICELYFLKSKLYQGLGNYNYAERWLNKTLSLYSSLKPNIDHNNLWVLYHELGAVKFQEQKLYEALKYFKKALATIYGKEKSGIAKFAIVHCSLGYIYYKLGEFGKAEKAYFTSFKIHYELYPSTSNEFYILLNNMLELNDVVHLTNACEINDMLKELTLREMDQKKWVNVVLRESNCNTSSQSII
jgi:tetratricopeptide (TPR) repeat protein